MDSRHLSIILLGLALCQAGCDTASTPTPKTSPATPTRGGVQDTSASAPSTTAEPTAVTEAESSGTPIEGPTGKIEGTVRFVGDEIPKSTIVSNGTDPQICGMEISKRDVEISPETRGIRYVLVWLDDVKLPDAYKPPTQNLILDNSKCQFEPHAAAITAGSVIETRNSDEVYHTTNLFGKMTKENIPLISKGASHKTRVGTTELIQVKCDKHGWMQAYIRVDPHPFHAVTDADGKFTIAGVPVGTYKLKVWHETFSKQDFDVAVTENESVTLEVKYPANDEK